MGQVFLTGTTLGERAALRACFVTSEGDVDMILNAVRSAAGRLDQVDR